MCKLLKVSRSSYYKSLNQVKSKRSIENKRLKEEILKIYNDNKKDSTMNFVIGSTPTPSRQKP